ncbi:hypothetical protein [Vibrio coralliilyticus]|uniref:hypothetical protein n=1 Tax=Vibrio coralliilyticus TaxID=190893 RepID=UPI0006CD6E40|nr:hypothetical protein [Vibrio coralliilyticus]AXN30749.1 hypothetical protein DVV14_05235 [Vibrio coralliilyticus]KPH27133.1 hypothetical protein ADU60_02395 [Vibrio coralliilyticus]
MEYNKDMSVFNSDSIKKHIKETFTQELEDVYTQEKHRGYAEGMEQGRLSLDQELSNAKQELEDLNQSITQAKHSLSKLKQEYTRATSHQGIWDAFEQSIQAFNTFLVEEKKVLDPYLISHLIRVFGKFMDSESLKDTVLKCALEQVDDKELNGISIEVSESTFQSVSDKCPEEVKAKINPVLGDSEIIVDLPHQHIHVSTQGIKTHIKANLQELIDAL